MIDYRKPTKIDYRKPTTPAPAPTSGASLVRGQSVSLSERAAATRKA